MQDVLYHALNRSAKPDPERQVLIEVPSCNPERSEGSLCWE